MKQVLIAGGSGLIGRRLTTLLLEKGYVVSWLSTSNSKADGINVFSWDPSGMKMEVAAIQQCDAIVNLSGVPVASPGWTSSYRKQIIDSRIQAAQCILKTLRENTHHTKVLISSSAIGFYGDRATELLKEESPKGTGFLADTTSEWEKAYQHTLIRTCLFRIGMVLSKEGGALKKMSAPLPFGVCPILGDGKQFISWIHLDDICLQIIHAIENEKMQGIYNAVSPHPVNMKDFMKELRKVILKWSVPVPVPAFILRLLMGERSSIILNSTKVSATKIEKEGFTFTYPTLSQAFTQLYGK